jgi:glycolate oxidase iron-sulfur subunit
VADFTVFSDQEIDRPRRQDLDRCVHCGLCLQACPTYRQLGVEMDSPRGRIYQMVQVADGQPISDSYREHLDLCLACRACETACPSGVQYGRLIEDARAEIEARTVRPWHIRALRWFVFERLLSSPALLSIAGSALWIYQVTGIQRLVRATGILGPLGLKSLESLTPPAEPPFFFSQIGKTFPARGERRYRVALMAGCIGSVSFARLNEATVRVLQQNGCEVVIPHGQTCCGALLVHSGVRGEARMLARRNIDAVLDGHFDAVISNAAGCGSTLKEYDHLLDHDFHYAAKARKFVSLMRDVNEFLAAIPLNPHLAHLQMRVTYQDSCHLAHGQKIRKAPRQLLAQVPGLDFREMPMADLCCGSAGIYNVLHTAMAMRILEEKMANVNSVQPDVIVTANTGCMLQLQAGAKLFGKGQRVMHVIEVLDEAYRGFEKAPQNRA